MISPNIIRIGDRTFRVKQKSWYQTDFEDDTAYLLSKYNDYVYPYRPEVTDISMAYQPGIYVIKKRVIVVRPRTDADKELYSKKRVITLTPDSIFENIDDNIIELPSEPITDGDIFKPAIKDSDDIALAGMKYVIGEKNINFNTYANRFPDMATKNNGRRALTHGNTLKMDMLARFADVFDINAALAFWDKKGCKNPIAKDYDKVYVIYNGDKVDFKDPNISIEEIVKD